MAVSFVPRLGGVLSADIAVPEHEREVRFYSRMLTTGQPSLWREHDLTNNLGLPIVGLGARTEEYEHLPLQWMPHIQVADVADSAQRALDLGGRIAMHAQDDHGTSQWAVLLDPNGAAFGIIPVAPEAAVAEAASDASLDVGSVGRIGWLDLTVPDAVATRNFYREVVGWSSEAVDMGEGSDRYADYAMLDEDGNPVAGICHARGVNAGLPPVWVIYLVVGDLSESLRRVQEEGGEILRTMKEDDGELTYAMVRDPVGACLALIAANRAGAIS